MTDAPVAAPWLTPEVEWFGLESVTDLLQVPVRERHFELFLMTRTAPPGMAMYMTDQF